MDTFSIKQRSECMSKIRSKNTKPEIVARKALTRMGKKYRLHSSKLPGKPDIVFLSAKKVIFINGCFWHQHKGCKRSTIPKSNRAYWQPKLKRNIQKQKQNIKLLEMDGWDIMIIWECETKDNQKLQKKLEGLDEKNSI